MADFTTERYVQKAKRVLDQACTLATHDWEYGTAAEALLEFHNPELSVFSDDPFPDGQIPLLEAGKEPLSLQYAEKYIHLDGELLYPDDGSPSDPASLGVSAILLGQSRKKYMDAAQRQSEHLLSKAPRYSNGAISHRERPAEVWADFVYMAPPFIAYHAVATDTPELLSVAGKQCLLYQEVLELTDSNTPSHGLWKHIVGPENEDVGLWCTSNAWAAMGMARVLAVYKKWSKGRKYTDESFPKHQNDLESAIKGILDGAMRDATKGNPPLLCCYLHRETSFGEIAGTALLGATAFRMVRLLPDSFGERYLKFAHDCLKAVEAHTDNESGIAIPVANPYELRDDEPRMEGTSEGQSMVALLWAAFFDHAGVQR